MRSSYFSFLSLALSAFLADADGTGRFHVDFSTNTCVKDCEPGGPLDSDGTCGGVVIDPLVQLFTTLEDCCREKLSWIRNDICVANSKGTASFSNKFYVDWIGQKCVKDCNPSNGLPCMGNPTDSSGFPTQLFDTARECCMFKLPWLVADQCVADSTAGTPPPPTNPPIPHPQIAPTRSPTRFPSVSDTCQTDSECNQICSIPVGGYQGKCVPALALSGRLRYRALAASHIPTHYVPPAPTPPATVTSQPVSYIPAEYTPTAPCQCTNPSNIPDRCEVELLISIMEIMVKANRALLAEWTRAAFHDAGTYDQNFDEGGANGCLLNFPAMRYQHINRNLDAPLNTLQAIKDTWIAHPDTCIDVSSADMLQFAIFFATTRQTGVPGLDLVKLDTLMTEFEWGREDEANCDVTWTENLPGFITNQTGHPIPMRCIGAGKEIEDKMMIRNGFTAEEATALLGAHTIGMMRNEFGSSHVGPWVPNGADNATPKGPVFDNAYHSFLINTVTATTLEEFGANAPFPGNNAPFTTAPFDEMFPSWFRDTDSRLNFLDTDIALAFPQYGGHPDYSVYTNMFAVNNDFFLDRFFKALKKMSLLGVNVPLYTAGECGCVSTQRRKLQVSNGFQNVLTIQEILAVVEKLGNATACANMDTFETQAVRRGEINMLTTPYNTSVTISTTTTTSTMTAPR